MPRGTPAGRPVSKSLSIRTGPLSGPSGWTDVGVADVEDAGRDLLDGRCQHRAHVRSDLKPISNSRTAAFASVVDICSSCYMF